MSGPLEALLGLSRLSEEARVLQLLVELGCEVVGGDEGSIALRDGDELVFVLTTTSGDQDIIGERIGLGQGLTGLAAMTGDVQIGAPTYVLDGQHIPTEDGVTRPAAVLAAPMFAGGEVIGVITAVSHDASVRFTGAHARLYGMIGHVAGIVVHQRQALEQAAGHADDGVEARLGQRLASLSRGEPHRLEAALRLLDAAAELADIDAPTDEL